ncbi:MAG: TolC family protein, partial [Thermoguttaceae bacterium]
MLNPGSKRSCCAGSVRIALVLAMALLSGCSRSHYRLRADREVQCLVESGSRDPRWALEDYTIDTDSRSRYHDPNSLDCPPMPVDDPTSHQLMHCVDGMRGYKHWHKFGDTPYADNPYWKAYLPLNEKGELVLDRRAAVQIALIHSPTYRTEVEDLYLSALNVTFERFQFDTQFFGGNDSFFTTTGPLSGDAPSRTTFENDAVLSLRRQFATGGELVAGVANSVVWELGGPNSYRASTPITFNLIQPLLRAAGRAVVLEDLTQSERNLLANIRQMERFRQSFYNAVVAGRAGVQGPTPAGVGLPSVSGGFSSSAGGFLSLLERQVRIRNLEANVVGNQDSLYQMEALFDANRVRPRSQVELIRQSLYNSQSDLLTERASYEESLDSFKVSLGLPPELDVRIEDPLLHQFDLIDPQLSEVQNVMNDLLQMFRDDATQPALEVEWYDELGPAREHCQALLAMVANDIQQFEKAIPDRTANLQLLAARPEAQSGQIDKDIFNTTLLRERLALLRAEFKELSGLMTATFTQVQSVESIRQTDAANPKIMSGEARRLLVDVFTELYDELLELSLLQARARLDTVTLIPIELSSEDAIEIARVNRLDWMNARAAVVDQWRLIEVAANALKSDLDVVVDGRIDPLSSNLFGSQPVNNTTGTLRVGLQFDAPLNRLAERNIYRRALINYQRTRRDYYNYEDLVKQGLRDAIRTIRLSQINFEVRRAGVFVAIVRTDMTRLQLTEPPAKGSSVGATTARDVQDALTALLRAQNEFLSVWVNYEVQRMNLDLDLGTMRLDSHGMWIDPGAVTGDRLRPTETVQPLPGVEPNGGT